MPTGFWWGNKKGRGHSEKKNKFHVDAKIILKCIIKK